jgi:uncharacterized protein YacL
MSKIDKAKEYIGILKFYMGILTALIIGDVSGTAKLFNSGSTGTTFWLGIISTLVLSFLFIRLARYTHKKIEDLEDL